MRNRAVHVRHHFSSNIHVEIFFAPVFTGGRDCTVDALQPVICMYPNTCVDQSLQHARANRVHDVFVNQQTLRCATNSGAAGLGVQNHIQRFDRIGVFVEVDMHDALKMRKNRHPRFALHKANKPFATAWHDHINRIHHRQKLLHSSAITGRHQLDRVFGQTRRFQTFDQTGVNGRRAVKALGSTA